MQVDPDAIEFAARVITSEVRTLRVRGMIRRCDEDDIASEAMTQLLAAWSGFDPDRAPAEAFINQVVSTRLVSILRKRSAQKRRGNATSIDATDDRLVDQACEARRRLTDLRIDLETALGKLTPKQREICDHLLRDAISPAARELGMPRSTLRDAVAKIREVFRDAGLEEYL